MSREKDCKWYFGPQSGQVVGPSDAVGQNFKNLYGSLVREAIQNSLDAAADVTKPVRVRFEFGTISSNDFPNFFDLRHHIQGCLDYYKDNTKAQTLYSGMLKHIPEGLSKKKEIGFLRVSDFNTKGMWYEPRNTSSTFFAFVKAVGLPVKEGNDSGGAFGFGKAAYTKVSPYRAMIVSSMCNRNGKDEYVFEGMATLCTHLYLNEEKTAVGFYTNADKESPVTDVENIPVPFKRTEYGTSMTLMGVDWKDAKNDKVRVEACKEILLEVLRSFWLAVYNGKLIVEIEKQTVSKDNVEALLNSEIPETEDSTRGATAYKPLPYFEAVAKCDIDDNHVCFKKALPHLGMVQLFVNFVEDAPRDKVLFFRKQNMLIETNRYQTGANAYGVFVCDNQLGNNILKNLEPSSHDCWDKRNWVDDNSKVVPTGEEVINAIKDFVNESLRSHITSTGGNTSDISAVNDHLHAYLPDDGVSNDTVQLTSDMKNEPKEQTWKKVEIGTIQVVDNGKLKQSTDSNAKERGGRSKDKDKKKPKGTGGQAGKETRKSDVTQDDKSTYSDMIDVRYTPIAEKDSDGRWIHHFIIHSNEDHTVSKGRMTLSYGTEGKDESAEIVYTSMGTIKGADINDLVINPGRNKISVKFKDNIQHSVRIKVYEYK